MKHFIEEPRQLTVAELDEVAGGLALPNLGQIFSGSRESSTSITNIGGQNVGVGAISLGGFSLFNISIGIGELNVNL